MNPQQDKDPDDARSDFEMTFGGSVPKTNICLQESTADNTQGHRWYYAPQVDEVQTERPDDLAVGLYYGWGTEICWNSKNLRDYPYMSHCNYDGYGNRLGISPCLSRPMTVWTPTIAIFGPGSKNRKRWLNAMSA